MPEQLDQQKQPMKPVQYGYFCERIYFFFILGSIISVDYYLLFSLLWVSNDFSFPFLLCLCLSLSIYCIFETEHLFYSNILIYFY